MEASAIRRLIAELLHLNIPRTEYRPLGRQLYTSSMDGQDDFEVMITIDLDHELLN